MTGKILKKPYKTIQQSVTFRGVGVHSGIETTVTLHPSENGIAFSKKGSENIVIPATVDNVLDTIHGTSIGSDAGSFGMVEHLLATLYANGIDGARIIVENGTELPILDGSAVSIVSALKQTEVAVREEIKLTDPIAIKKPFFFQHKESFLAVYPAPEFAVSYFISYREYPELTQLKTIVVNAESFEKEIAPARTYAFLEWIEPLRKQGLIKGGSLENSLVYSKDGFLNPLPLRFPDELVRHKILDFIGDISLYGRRIIGHFVILCGGHTAHIAFLRALKSELE